MIWHNTTVRDRKYNFMFALMKFMEVLLNVCPIVLTVVVNKCIFCVNKQQKV